MSMGGSKGMIKDNGSIAKIASALYYKAAALDYLVNSSLTQKAVKTKIFNQINKDFSFYTDAQARSYTSRLHHVYEWRRPGDPSARLWSLDMTPSTGYNMSLSYSFKQSRSNVPNTRSLKKYVFKEKARIMEFRIPVTKSIALNKLSARLVIFPTILPRKALIALIASEIGSVIFLNN